MKKSELRQIIKEEISKILNEAFINDKGELTDFEYNLTPPQEQHLLRINKMSLQQVLDKLNDLMFNPDNLPPQYKLSIHDDELMYDAENHKWVDGNLSESKHEKNYEYFYNRISKGVDKFKQMLRDSGHID